MKPSEINAAMAAADDAVSLYDMMRRDFIRRGWSDHAAENMVIAIIQQAIVGGRA